MVEVRTKPGIEIKTKSKGGKTKQSVTYHKRSANKTIKTTSIYPSLYLIIFKNGAATAGCGAGNSYVATAETSWMLGER